MLVGLDLIPVRPECGGVHTLIRGIVPELVRRHPEHEWHIFQAADVAPFTHRLDGARIHFLKTKSLAATLNRAVIDLMPDVLFRAFPLKDPLDYLLKKQVVLIPDLQHEYLEECLPKNELHDRQEAFRKVQGGAGALGTLSSHGIETLRRSPWTQCTDLFLMPPGACQPPAQCAELPGELRDKTFFYYPANLWPHKNHGNLLEAFKRFAAKQSRPVWLVLTGNAQGWPELRARYPDVPVMHLGRVPDARLWALYRHARALCFFSRFEGFGIPLLEAFASGLPVACSNLCSLPEVGGDAVATCDPCDPDAMAGVLETIHSDENLRARLIAAGRERLKAYSYEKSAEQLHAALIRVGVLGSIARVESIEAVPELSVVLPMLDHRGFLENCLQSFLDQRCDPKRYELAVIANGRQAELERRAEELIRGRGRVVRFDTQNEMELYHRGALSSRSPCLLLTEGHCSAKPETIAGILRYFENPQANGGLLHSESKNSNEFGECEGILYQESLAQWRKPDDWHKVGLRGFAIRRSVLERVGGFDYRYGLFAEQILAAALFESGITLDFLEHVPIVHHNTAHWGELDESIDHYVVPECAYRLSHASRWCRKRFGTPAMFEARCRYAPPMSLALFNAAMRPLASSEQSLDERVRLLKTICVWFLEYAPATVLGEQWMCARIWLKRAIAKLSFGVRSSKQARLEAYRSVWKLTAELFRTRFLTCLALEKPELDAQAFHPAEDLEEWQVPGFHTLESHEGRWFRWSSQVSILRFAAHAGDMEAHLDTGGLPRARHPILFFNGQRVPHKQIQSGANCLRFPLRREDFVTQGAQELTLVCKPLDTSALPYRESRKLGLPVFGLRLESLRS